VLAGMYVTSGNATDTVQSLIRAGNRVDSAILSDTGAALADLLSPAGDLRGRPWRPCRHIASLIAALSRAARAAPG
jgi:hypothetical protein